MRLGAIRKNVASVSEYLAVTLVWFVAAFPLFSGKRWLYGFDLISYAGPSIKIAFDSWTNGHLPLWDPFSFGGVPFLGRLGSGGMYFPHLPFTIFEIHTAIQLSIACHLLLLAIGVVFLVRKGLKLSAPTGAISAIVVIGSSFVMVNLLSLDRLIAISWIPWILFFIERIFQSLAPYRYVFGLTISTSALIFGGHPQFIHMFAIFLVLYVLTRFIETKSWNALLQIVLAGGFTFGITSLQLVATYFLSKSSPMTSSKTLESLKDVAYTLAPQKIWLGITGDPFSANPIAVTGTSEAIAGIGLVAVILACVAVISWVFRPQGLMIPFLTLASIAGVVLSVGARWIPFRIAYNLIPGFSNGRVPGRLIVISLFALVLLSAYGIHNLIKGAVSHVQIITLIALLSLLTIFINWSVFDDVSLHLMLWIGVIVTCIYVLKIVQLPILKTALVMLLTALAGYEAVNTISKTQGYRTTLSSPMTDYANPISNHLENMPGRAIALTNDTFGDFQYLIEGLRPNIHTLYEIESIDGYDGGPWIQDRWVKSMTSLTEPSFSTYLTLRSQIKRPVDAVTSGRLGIRWAIIDTNNGSGNEQLSGWVGPIVRWKTFELWENLLAINSAQQFFNAELVEEITNDQQKLKSTAYVENANLGLDCNWEEECASKPVDFLKYEGDKFTYLVRSTKPSILVINQSWHSDWRVHINGKRTDSFPVNGLLLGVRLQEGESIVVFEFRPTWYEPLFILSMISLGLSGLYSMRKKKVNKNGSSYEISQ